MEEDRYFPPIPEGAVYAFDILIQNIQQDPDYLLDAPYDPEELKFLEKFAADVVEDEQAEPSDKWSRLESETNNLFKLLTQEAKDLGSKNNAETMSYFRTATHLIDKIVGIQERAANLKQIHQFYNAVLTAMEDNLDPGQRTEVMEQLRKAAGE